MSRKSSCFVQWDYFWHFDRHAIVEGCPWDLLDEQGNHRTIWAGSSACFESILDVVQYNELLFDMLQLDEVEKE